MAATYQPSQWLIPKNENTDKVGNYSLDFDGSADCIDMGDVLGFDYDDPFSISTWVNIGSGHSGAESVVSKELSTGTYRGYHFLVFETGCYGSPTRGPSAPSP